MAQKRYEMSDEQWIQIKDLFPVAKTGAPPGVTCQSVLARGKRYTAAFVNGVMTEHY
ncbi:MAG: hypothetical protein K0R05_3735 [Anaerocolumna sp.]|nr:hypothetical protein [Anaerocolumna sp.]